MKARIISDLHLMHDKAYSYVSAGEDVILSAGDLSTASAEGRALAEAFIRSSGKPFYHILGNHDFYRGEWRKVIAYWRALRIPNLHFLHNKSVRLGPVTLLGTPLFTDFNLYGTPSQSIEAAHRSINDFQYYIMDGKKPLAPQRYVQEYHRARIFLLDALERAKRPVVVMTHWGPAPEVVSDCFRGDDCNPFFVVDAREFIRPPVRLWIHGHSHTKDDQVINGVRVLRHPKGYPRERHVYEPLVVSLD